MKLSFYNFLTALALFVSLTSVTAAQSQSEAQSEDSPADAPKAGVLSGRVVNESGQPLANAIVSIRPFGTGVGGNTTTNSEGSFQLGGLTPTVYLVSASYPGYVPVPRDPDVNPIGYYRIGDSVRLEMVKGGVITGIVTKTTGEPVVAVAVRAYLIRDSRGQPARYTAPSREQTTDDRGVYRIYGLPIGTYVVSAGGGNSSIAWSTDTPTFAPSSTRETAAEISVNSNEETTGVDIRYRGGPGHRVSGTASSTVAVDQPLDFTITLSPVVNGESQASYSSSQPPGGRGFSFYGVADGDYYVIAQTYFPGGDWGVSEPRRIRVSGADVTGIELTAPPFGSVGGRVLLEESKAPECKDKRRPLFGETVVGAWHNDKTAAKDQPQFVWGLGGTTLPSQQGEFVLRNLAPGQYRFNARPMAKYWYLKSISWPTSPGPSVPATQANRPADAARYWTTLKKGDRFSGLTIKIAEGAASLRGQIETGEDQKLPPRLFIYLAPAEREEANNVLRYFGSLVWADGSFALNNLPPGRYWVVARPAREDDANVLVSLRLPDETETRAKLLRDAEAGKITTELKPCQNVLDYRFPFKIAGGM